MDKKKNTPNSPVGEGSQHSYVLHVVLTLPSEGLLTDTDVVSRMPQKHTNISLFVNTQELQVTVYRQKATQIRQHQVE